MKLHTFAASALLALSVWLTPFAASRADTVLYDASSFVEGQQSFTQSFNVSGPGTLTVSITDIAWLDIVADLNCFLSTASGLINPAANGNGYGSGSESFNVGSGPIYAHWFGSAQGIYDLGVIGVKITFQPAGIPVPLPASLVLLLSGLGVLFGWQRRPMQPAVANASTAAA
jgi:hypothetical protein